MMLKCLAPVLRTASWHWHWLASHSSQPATGTSLLPILCMQLLCAATWHALTTRLTSRESQQQGVDIKTLGCMMHACWPSSYQECVVSSVSYAGMPSAGTCSATLAISMGWTLAVSSRTWLRGRCQRCALVQILWYPACFLLKAHMG